MSDSLTKWAENRLRELADEADTLIIPAVEADTAPPEVANILSLLRDVRTSLGMIESALRKVFPEEVTPTTPDSGST